MKRIKFVGLDVHAETIAVAVAEQEGEIRSLGIIPNREESIRKLVKKLGPVEQLQFCLFHLMQVIQQGGFLRHLLEVRFVFHPRQVVPGPWLHTRRRPPAMSQKELAQPMFRP